MNTLNLAAPGWTRCSPAPNLSWTLSKKTGNYPGKDPPTANPTKSRLLVVDDEAAMCELLALFFEHKGLEVTTARTADEGTALIEQERFDLAILDWKLDGAGHALDLLELSKARHPEVPVIIFTGCDESIDLEQQLAGRADAVMRKMGSLQALSVEVGRQLAK